MRLGDDYIPATLDEWNKVGELYRDLHSATGINDKECMISKDRGRCDPGILDSLRDRAYQGYTVAQRNAIMMGNWRKEADTKTIKGHSHDKDSGTPEVDVTRSDTASSPAQYGDGIFITGKSSIKKYHTQLNGVVINSETGVAKDSDVDFSKIRIWE